LCPRSPYFVATQQLATLHALAQRIDLALKTRKIATIYRAKRAQSIGEKRPKPQQNFF
jgi:hypothetical protein